MPGGGKGGRWEEGEEGVSARGGGGRGREEGVLRVSVRRGRGGGGGLKGG